MHPMVIPSQEWRIMWKSHVMKRTLMVATKATYKSHKMLLHPHIPKQRMIKYTHQRHKTRLCPYIPKQQTIKYMFRRMR